MNDKQVYQATVVTKPTPARSITVSGGAKVVTIGDKAWVATDGKTFQSVPSSVVTTMIGAFDPNLMLGAFGGPALTQKATDMGVEQKNGVSAHHFHVDAASLPASFRVDPAERSRGHLGRRPGLSRRAGDVRLQRQ